MLRIEVEDGELAMRYRNAGESSHGRARGSLSPPMTGRDEASSNKLMQE